MRLTGLPGSTERALRLGCPERGGCGSGACLAGIARLGVAVLVAGLVDHAVAGLQRALANSSRAGIRRTKEAVVAGVGAGRTGFGTGQSKVGREISGDVGLGVEKRCRSIRASGGVQRTIVGHTGLGTGHW